MDCSLPGSFVHGILQARILEWLAIPFSRGSSWPKDQTQVSWTAGRFFTIWAYQYQYQFSCSIVSYSLWPHEPQQARPPCPSPTSGIHPNPCPLSRWCHPTISSSVVLFSSCSIFPSIRGFSNESALHIRWPKYFNFSFNISPSKEHPGLIYRMD